MAEQYNYSVDFYAIGMEDEIVGSPTQMALFNL
jgi:hypothetical protein